MLHHSLHPQMSAVGIEFAAVVRPARSQKYCRHDVIYRYDSMTCLFRAGRWLHSKLKCSNMSSNACLQCRNGVTRGQSCRFPGRCILHVRLSKIEIEQELHDEAQVISTMSKKNLSQGTSDPEIVLLLTVTPKSDGFNSIRLSSCR
jgi:hypothetical protein